MANKQEVLKFSSDVETLAKTREISYMEAVLLHCETIGFEVELSAKLISSSLKSKIKAEAENLNFIRKSKTKKLPL